MFNNRFNLVFASFILLQSCTPGRSDVSFEIVNGYYLSSFSSDRNCITKGKWGEIIVEDDVISFAHDKDNLFVLRELSRETDENYSNLVQKKSCMLYRVNFKLSELYLVEDAEYDSLMAKYPGLTKPLVKSNKSSCMKPK
jgi:hypothetical protein